MDITKKQKQEFKKLAEKYKLNFLVLFGSQAEGVARSGSDYDIGYSPQKEIDYRKEYFMEREIARILKQGKIDLASTKRATPLLMYNMAYNSQLLFEREKNSFDYFQMYAFKMYIEAKPLFKMIHDYIDIKYGD
ncbi:hypothetical protein COV49_04145 [Candidatus Falkowbacteria bacterium CG11_big_fil_rev_8_21_14_0_20_39_10]|uniref:Polymerase beta nucleotidyltransferase domain-containing protein n=1 Tax=Candidatus Falkowbacteria bacterium CG11_big_fil_rev_8_21_14_0_20_39_10 TaxID=1974570 RepID=A0A2M6K8A5_9BACT|nr:MAG: hypothetical protein COV49_04145 [Candidatus Falkowbacteria bacterium CG11_big_fil_rev_8_21_14_0_20_39_10]